MLSPTELRNLATAQPDTSRDKSIWRIDAKVALIDASETIELMVERGWKIEQQLHALQVQVNQLKGYE